ncbi:MAG: hypothetical protein JXB07_04530 [Anaerolineae bacterium]|nr:hypothetical protein [Anaerolineae bacterium]
MNFRDYRWFRNPRGLHNNGPYSPLNTTRYIGTKMGWARLVVGGTEQIEAAQRLVEQGCMPIVRIFRERMGAMPALDGWYDLYRQYFEAGSCWFELYDEPNLESSWPSGAGPTVLTVDWHNTEGCIRPLMDNWLDWAERIIEMGGYPAFPAMAETVEPRQATIAWLEACLKYLRENQATRFIHILTNGLWCATHPYVLNHFYQEPPGGPSYVARPYYQQSAAEGGWHFEYPYDPLQQRSDPGRTMFGGTPNTPHGDPNGLIATGQAFQELLKRIFDAGPVPVVGTAGGIGPIPGPTDEPMQQDNRYPPFSRDSHAEATLAMWRWISHQGPPWLFGLTLSTEADYYDRQGAVPAIELMLVEAPVVKDVPDLEICSEIAIEDQAQPEPADSSPPLPIELMPEFSEEPDLGVFLEETAAPSTPLPSEDAFEAMLFKASELEAEMQTSEFSDTSTEDEMTTALIDESGSDMWREEDAAETLPAEEAEASAETPPFKEAFPLLNECPEISQPDELPQFEAVELFRDEVPDVMLSEAEMSQQLEEVEPLPEEEIVEMFDPEDAAEKEETSSDTATEISLEISTGETPSMAKEPPADTAFAPTIFEESQPELEPIPFENWDDEPLPEVSPIEAVLPELSWDYVVPSTPAAEGQSISEGAEPIEEKVLPQLLQDVSTIDDLRAGPPPEKLDHHFLIVTSGLSPEWFFDNAYRYWRVFRPTILPCPDLMGMVSGSKSIAVTVMATVDTAREIHSRIHDQWPGIYIDLMVFNTLEAMCAELDRRAAQEQRFG